MKKFLCLPAFLVLVATSHASFEMALVAQTHTPSNGPGSRKIGRWDPQNGVFLGYFGAGAVVGNALTIDQTQPNTVLDIFGSGNSIVYQRFNYSTGENLGLSSITSVGTNNILDAQSLSSGQILMSGILGGAVTARLLNSNGSTARTYTLLSGTTISRSIFQNSSGVTFILTRQAGTTSGDKYSLTSYAANSATIASTVVVADNTSTVYDNIIQSGNTIVIGSSLVNLRRTVAVTGTNLGVSTNTLGYVIASDTYFAGHGNAYYAMGFDSANSRVYLSSLTGSGIGTYTSFDSAQYGQIYDSAIVVAPEPVTMVGLGLGLAAVLRRRRNRFTL